MDVGDPDPMFDPLADLLFSLVAIVVLAVIVLLPTIRTTPDLPETTLVRTRLTDNGAPVALLVADGDGVRYGQPEAGRVALNAVLDDSALASWLAEVKRSNIRLLLAIAGDGQEAAFELEPLIARHGPARFSQIRLGECTDHGGQGGCAGMAPPQGRVP